MDNKQAADIIKKKLGCFNKEGRFVDSWIQARSCSDCEYDICDRDFAEALKYAVSQLEYVHLENGNIIVNREIKIRLPKAKQGEEQAR